MSNDLRLVIHKNGGYHVERLNCANPADRLDCMIGYALEAWETNKVIAQYSKRGNVEIVDTRDVR